MKSWTHFSSKKRGATAMGRRVSRASPEVECLVLFELPGGERRLEPLLDLSVTGASVLLRKKPRGVAPGLALGRICLFAEGECVLECGAVVRDVETAATVEGAAAVKLGLQLRPSGAGAEIPAPATVELMQPTVIADALTNLAATRASVHVERSVEGPSHSQGELVVERFDPGRESVVLRIEKGHAPHLRRGCEYGLAAEVYGTRMALVAKYRDRHGAELRFSWPRTLRVWKHSRDGRLRRPVQALEVELRAPLVRSPLRRRVVDVSATGLAIEAGAEDHLLVGMRLRELRLQLPRGVVAAEAVVRHVEPVRERVAASGGGLVVGLELIAVGASHQRLLAGFVDEHLHPEVRPAQASDLPRLWPLYGAAGMFARPWAAVSPLMERIAAARETLLTKGGDVLIQVVGDSQGEIHATAELLRAYGDTWSLQHVAVLEGARSTADALVLSLVRTALRRADVAHVHAILDPDCGRDGLERLAAFDIHAETLVIRERMLVRRVDAATEAPPLDVVPAGGGELEWVADRLRERLSALEIAGLALSASALTLAETSRRYTALELERSLAVRLVMGVGGPLGFSLIERSSPGLSPVRATFLVRPFVLERDPVLRRQCLLSLAADALRPTGDPDPQTAAHPGLLLVTVEEAEVLAANGFESLGSRLELVASREGAGVAVNCLHLLS